MTLIRRRQLLEELGISGSTLDRLIRRGEFPPPLRLGARAVAWRKEDVATWIEARAAEAATRADG